jgi:hypothetical protein
MKKLPIISTLSVLFTATLLATGMAVLKDPAGQGLLKS